MRDRIVSAKRAGREEEASKAEVVGIITPSRASAAAAIHETANGVNNISLRAIVLFYFLALFESVDV